MITQKVVAIIPARLESTRLNKKLLLDLKGKPVIQRVYDNINSFGLFSDIYVATDSSEIIEFCDNNHIKHIQTSSAHQSGTSRIAEASKEINADIIVNVQGDEPFISNESLKDLISALNQNTEALIATLIYASNNEKEANDPNIVKVVKDLNNYALYFSRLPIPFNRANPQNSIWFHHIGVYAYKQEFLSNYHSLKKCSLEETEKLEQLSFLTNGYKIMLVETFEKTLGIDTEDDLKKAIEILSI